MRTSRSRLRSKGREVKTLRQVKRGREVKTACEEGGGERKSRERSRLFTLLWTTASSWTTASLELMRPLLDSSSGRRGEMAARGAAKVEALRKQQKEQARAAHLTYEAIANTLACSRSPLLEPPQAGSYASTAAGGNQQS